ncbi:MAG: VWA domain-containing protein [Pseudomonadales bacterium]|jgi:Ca-activated chloride channel family protein|nr:VWA domain-containing protein [Pseudomonadales bacterium]
MTGFDDFHFLRPEWLWGLIPVAFAALLLLRRRLDVGRWKRAVDPDLAAWLVESGWRGGARLGVVAMLLAWSAAILAMAGPTWERRPQPVSRTDDALVVVLDLSLSMYAQDITPSRLVRARLKIADVLEARKDGQTALVVYAGDAHVVVPLTDDIRTINNLLPSLEPGVMPVLGSRVQDALASAGDLLDEAGARSGRILLITDEIVDTGSTIDAAAGRYPVLVLGVGTEAGAPIPLAAIDRTGFLESGGRTVVATLDEGPLRAVANATGGRYTRFETSDADLRTLLGGVLDASGEENDRDREFDLWIDMGPWLVLLVLPVVLLSFRRGVVAVLAVAALGPIERAEAADGGWFATPDQQGYRALREGRADEAVELFEDRTWQAVALYRAEEYEAAASAFSAADAESLYNTGTALARAMKLPEAQVALTEALALDPEHADARHNLELVEKLLEDQRQNAENEQGSPQEDPNSEGNESEASQRDQESQSQAGEQEDESAESGQGEQEEEQEAAESDGEEPQDGEQEGEQSESDELMAQRSREQEQALEQWLRRVPDEPGALLRRKFRYETDRRYRQGLRRAPQDQQPW